VFVGDHQPPLPEHVQQVSCLTGEDTQVIETQHYIPDVIQVDRLRGVCLTIHGIPQRQLE